MRAKLSLLISLIFSASCALAPDSLIVTPRIDKRGNYDSTSIGMVFRNPWLPRHVVQENWLIPREGFAGGENL